MLDTMPNRSVGRWLTTAERKPVSLSVSDTLANAVDAFQLDTDLRLLPIVDRRGRTVGAIFEKDVRRLLLNPFGHALLRNPTFNSDLDGFIRQCPVHELTDDIGVLVDHYRQADGREGMVLTRGGQLYATLSNRRLLLLAAEREQQANKVRLARAERISQAGALFESHAAVMSTQMVQLADAVQRLAEATVDRASIASNRAASVAGAAVQTRESMAMMADRGRGLAAAFNGIETAVDSSRRTASDTAVRVVEGNKRARALVDAAQSVDAVMALVNEIAGTVNLLSLNAAIEAARAGESGRGFAVVATEIRTLAEQTRAATDQISGQVETMRVGARSVAADYAAMEQAIATIADEVSEIDQAIVREAGTTRLIADSVGEASAASVEIEQAIVTIVGSVRAASTSARELDSLANQLRQGAGALSLEVSNFLGEVRAA